MWTIFCYIVYHLGHHRVQAENSWFKLYSEQHFLWCDSAMKLGSVWQSLCIHHICSSRAIRQLTIPEQTTYCTREDSIENFLKEPWYCLHKRVVCIAWTQSEMMPSTAGMSATRSLWRVVFEVILWTWLA